MAYTYEKYYPLSGVEELTQSTVYNAYKAFFEENEILQRRFTVTYDDDGYTITFAPKEESIADIAFALYVYSNKVYFYNTNGGLALSTSTGSNTYYSYITWTDAQATALTILETNDFLGIDYTTYDCFDMMVVSKNGSHFDGTANEFPATVCYYYHYYNTYMYKNAWCYGANTATTYQRASTENTRKTATDTKYCLTKLIRGGTYTDVIYDNLYTIEGGTGLPAFGTPFKLNSNHYLMAFDNVCVKLD